MLSIFVRNLVTPFNLLNVGIIGALFVLNFVFNDSRLMLDSLGISVIVVINFLLAVIQEWRAHQALLKISLMQHRSARVIRGGVEVEIDRDDIEIADVVAVRRGDAIVVDGLVINSEQLEIDASFITGESAPLHVNEGDEITSGCVCTAGYGTYKAVRVGEDHTVARISDLARRYQLAQSPLQKTINHIFEFSFAAAVVLAAADVFLHWGLLNDVNLIRKIATLFLGLIPEGLVFFTTVSLAIGVYRISKLGVFVQKLNAVESFSAVDTVCMDKTGTLTMNKLTVHKIIGVIDDGLEPPALLKSYAKHSLEKDQVTTALQNITGPESSVEWQQRIPFSSARKWSAAKTQRGAWWVLGALEVLSGGKELEEIDEVMRMEGVESMRTVVFGTASNVDSNHVHSFRPRAVIALSDEVRLESKRTLELFDDARVDVRIVTGDGPESTLSILQKLDFSISTDQMISGKGLANAKGDLRETLIMEKKVFVRVMPEQKREIVATLQNAKRHVCVVGDGVNDLPAIKEAHVGIAVESASEATKDVADIVLEKQTFDVFPRIINEGRITVRTVLNVSRLYIGKNLVLLAMNAITSFAPLPYPLTPRRGALLSLIAVGAPAYLLAAFSTDTRKVNHFIREVLTFSAWNVLLSLLTVTATWLLANSLFGWPIRETQDLMFTSIVGVLLSAAFQVGEISKELQRWLLITALLIASIFILFVYVDSLPVPLVWIQRFYEINSLSFGKAVISTFVLGASIVVGVVGHFLRRRLEPISNFV